MDRLTYIAKEVQKTFKPSGKSEKTRWHPDDSERCDCCRSIRSPSRAFPHSLWTHCNSLKHIKNFITKNNLHEEALAMTKETAPLYLNTENKILIAVRDHLLGINKESK